MKSKTKIALAIFLTAIISATGTYAAFLLAYPITTQIVVKRAVSMEVFDTDGVTPLTHINMGQCERNKAKWFPGGAIHEIGNSYTPSEFYYVNNTDEMSFYISFTWSNLPPDSPTLYIFVKRGDQATFTELSASGSTIYQFPIMTHLDDPDPAKQHAVWYFAFPILETVPFGTYTPTLTITAYDTATG